MRDDDKINAKEVLEEANLFYRNLRSNLRKKEELRKLCDNIDEVSANLKAIKKLEHCKELETSFDAAASADKAKEWHRERLRQINLKWWQRLDAYDDQ